MISIPLVGLIGALIFTGCLVLLVITDIFILTKNKVYKKLITISLIGLGIGFLISTLSL